MLRRRFDFIITLSLRRVSTGYRRFHCGHYTYLLVLFSHVATIRLTFTLRTAQTSPRNRRAVRLSELSWKERPYSRSNIKIVHGIGILVLVRLRFYLKHHNAFRLSASYGCWTWLASTLPGDVLASIPIGWCSADLKIRYVFLEY